jgi:hypothetical protein
MTTEAMVPKCHTVEGCEVMEAHRESTGISPADALRLSVTCENYHRDQVAELGTLCVIADSPIVDEDGRQI